MNRIFQLSLTRFAVTRFVRAPAQRKSRKKELSSKSEEKPNKRKEGMSTQAPRSYQRAAARLPESGGRLSSHRKDPERHHLHQRPPVCPKVVEVVPINFMLRSAREQQRNIIYSFVSYLKISRQAADQGADPSGRTSTVIWTQYAGRWLRRKMSSAV